MTPAEKRAHAEALMTIARALLEEADAEDAKGHALVAAGKPQWVRRSIAAKRFGISDRTMSRRAAAVDAQTLLGGIAFVDVARLMNSKSSDLS